MNNKTLGSLVWGGAGGKFETLANPVIRIGVAFVFFRHGWTKLFDPEGNFYLTGWISEFSTSDLVSFIPGIVVLSWLIVLIETAGALLLALGLFVRPVALSMLIFMITSILLRFPPDFSWPAGFSPVEKEFLLALFSYYFVVFGGGDLSLDAKLKKSLLNQSR